jgi:hypothetical protein
MGKERRGGAYCVKKGVCGDFRATAAHVVDVVPLESDKVVGAV